MTANDLAHQTREQGTVAGDYSAPLFLAWQLTNRCQSRCLTCCEESGADRAWPDELNREEAITLARDVIDARIPYVAFGGGEPLGVPHVWEILDLLACADIEIKIETNGLYITDEKADFLKALDVQCVQISVDGATRETHERVRPLGDYDGVMAAIQRLVKRDLRPEFVFVPNKHNIHEAVEAYELAVKLGCRAFVTGPMMRLGRAAKTWTTLSLDDKDWEPVEETLKQAADKHKMKLSIYPWDILEEMLRRLKSPQAILLVVPNGNVKLLNALPFAVADLRRHSIQEAWNRYQEAWKSEEVRHFIGACRTDPTLLRHANETWDKGEWDRRRHTHQN